MSCAGRRALLLLYSEMLCCENIVRCWLCGAAWCLRVTCSPACLQVPAAGCWHAGLRRGPHAAGLGRAAHHPSGQRQGGLQQPCAPVAVQLHGLPAGGRHMGTTCCLLLVCWRTCCSSATCAGPSLTCLPMPPAAVLHAQHSCHPPTIHAPKHHSTTCPTTTTPLHSHTAGGTPQGPGSSGAAPSNLPLSTCHRPAAGHPHARPPPCRACTGGAAAG